MGVGTIVLHHLRVLDHVLWSVMPFINTDHNVGTDALVAVGLRGAGVLKRDRDGGMALWPPNGMCKPVNPDPPKCCSSLQGFRGCTICVIQTEDTKGYNSLFEKNMFLTQFEYIFDFKTAQVGARRSTGTKPE